MCILLRPAQPQVVGMNFHELLKKPEVNPSFDELKLRASFAPASVTKQHRETNWFNGARAHLEQSGDQRSAAQHWKTWWQQKITGVPCPVNLVERLLLLGHRGSRPDSSWKEICNSEPVFAAGRG